MFYNIWLAYKFVTKLYETDHIFFVTPESTSIQMSSAGMREYLKGNVRIETDYKRWYNE